MHNLWEADRDGGQPREGRAVFWTWRMPRTMVAVALVASLVLASSLTAARRPFRVLASAEVVQPMGAIAFEATRELATAEVTLRPPVPGDVAVKGRRIEFRPRQPLRPGSDYTVAVRAVDAAGEAVEASLSLSVAPLHDALWVYVKLDEPTHRVYVYRGDTLVREMLASGGAPGSATPAGVFRIQNRGYHFYSQKYQQGAYYWVRIIGNYLFHTVPVDVDGNVIQEEAEKLGCPASHGCVRLSFPDARWLYENVPDGSLVVIDRT